MRFAPASVFHQSTSRLLIVWSVISVEALTLHFAVGSSLLLVSVMTRQKHLRCFPEFNLIKTLLPNNRLWSARRRHVAQLNIRYTSNYLKYIYLNISYFVIFLFIVLLSRYVRSFRVFITVVSYIINIVIKNDRTPILTRQGFRYKKIQSKIWGSFRFTPLSTPSFRLKGNCSPSQHVILSQIAVL